MKFWQKTYFFTLILFLVFLNAGLLSLTAYTYHKNVMATEHEAAAEQAYIVKSLERDVSNYFLLNSNLDPSPVMMSYVSYYQDNGIGLTFEKRKEDPADADSDPAGNGAASKNYLTYVRSGGKRHILIIASVCEDSYTMYFSKDISALDREFRMLTLTYTATALLISTLLAVSLYFILKRLSTPLAALREVTERIEAGDFSVRAREQGNDEFTQLAKSFNSMLVRINEQMEALETDAEKKQMLVDNLAHELRTPLTSIHGYAEFLEKAAAPEEKRIVAAKYILSESERLQKVSEILLDGAYIRGTPPKMQPVELSGLLLDTAEKLKQKADGCGVTLLCDVSPATVSGEPTLLSMVFYNLVENAIKACRKGGTVRMSCRYVKTASAAGSAAAGVTDNEAVNAEADATRSAADAASAAGAGATSASSDVGTVCAVVEDTGKGMTAEQLAHITEPFYRTDKSRSRAEGGAGLGLALCKQIVEIHQAKMQFESRVGEGTKVIVHF